MYDAYARIFTRLGLSSARCRPTPARSAATQSHEFQVLADSGEDAIAFSTGSDYAANIEMAEALAPAAPRPAPAAALERVATPTQKTIDEVAAFLERRRRQQCVKTIVVRGRDGLVALCVRGDHEINEVKAAKLAELPGESVLADEAEILRRTGARPGFARPGRLAGIDSASSSTAAPPRSPISSAAATRTARTITARTGTAMRAVTRVADIRKVVEGDPSPDGNGALQIARGIEVGHVFQLGQKYAEAMGASVLDEDRQGQRDADGLLRHRRQPHRRRRDRAEPRRSRHPLAGTDGAVARRDLPDQCAQNARVREAAERLYEELIGGRHRRRCSTIAACARARCSPTWS